MARSRARTTQELSRALGVAPRGVHAFVGAGGKTSAIRRLLSERPRALATTTTHLGVTGFGRGLLAVAPDTAVLERLQSTLFRARPLTLALGGSGARLGAPALDWHVDLGEHHAQELILVEADGAARCLLKLPGTEEPAWPPGPVARVVIVAGLAGLGQPLAQAAHHPERFLACGVRGRIVGPEHYSSMLGAYLRAAPPRAPLTLLLTGPHSAEPGLVEVLARECEALVRARDPRLQDPDVPLRVVACADLSSGPYAFWDLGRGRARRRRPRLRRRVPSLAGVCGVLLAAGLGTRFRASKQQEAPTHDDLSMPNKLLVRWRGRAVVEHAVRRWCAADPAALIVVTGSAAPLVESLVRRAAGVTPLVVVRNKQYARGLGTSVRAAAGAAPPGMGLLFGHADMPALRVETLRRIASFGTALRNWIVVPCVAGSPRNPVFFPADLREALTRVPDASGGKSVYTAERQRVFMLDMGRGEDLMDVDRAADLRRLEPRAAAKQAPVRRPLRRRRMWR